MPLSDPATNVGVMRLATWNVNSVSSRLPRLLEWLDLAKPDVLCLQETKTAEFPAAEVEALGYQVAAHGNGRWNGVALLSRVGIDDVSLGFPGEPGTRIRRRGRSVRPAAAIRIWSLYVPNGRTVTIRITNTSWSGSRH